MTALSVVEVGGGTWMAKLMCDGGDRPDWLDQAEWNRQLEFAVQWQWGREGGAMIVVHREPGKPRD